MSKKLPEVLTNTCEHGGDLYGGIFRKKCQKIGDFNVFYAIFGLRQKKDFEKPTNENL